MYIFDVLTVFFNTLELQKNEKIICKDNTFFSTLVLKSNVKSKIIFELIIFNFHPKNNYFFLSE